MHGEVVPFGKYKGQPVEALSADQDYCEWLLSQPWFKSKYGNVYNILITYGGEPQDSPEHNQMQARFLDPDWCLRLASLLLPGKVSKWGVAAPEREARADPLYVEFQALAELDASPPGARPEFEAGGWDVVFTIIPARVKALLPELPPCGCRCDRESCDRDHDPGKRGWRHHCENECPWRDEDKAKWLLEDFRRDYPAMWEPPTVRVELKPDLGDDYPAVLRQVARYRREYGDACCIVTRRHGFEHVTWDQVQRIFAASKVTLLTESEISATTPPGESG